VSKGLIRPIRLILIVNIPQQERERNAQAHKQQKAPGEASLPDGAGFRNHSIGLPPGHKREPAPESDVA
jgi:hypothetical protein